jgi:hypothetical protein
MSFLKCLPTVYVIGKEYEISITAKTNGLFSVKIGDEIFYQENTGLLKSEENYAKIRVPQFVLNEAETYEICFRETLERKEYFSQFKEMESVKFAFKPLKKRRDIKAYHIADVHFHFELAKKTAAYFGDDTDLFIFNGDIGEVRNEQDYFEVCSFVGEISKGEIPVLFVRGNHDTRGNLAEKYEEYFPAQNKDTYFTFELGCLSGVILDCGEDKPDSHAEYGGVNVFELFRRRETEFLKSVELDKDKICFSICHVCPSLTTFKKGSIFDIERDVYKQWNQELERMGIKFMVCGHYHKAFILMPEDERNVLPHKYPVIVASACFQDEDLWGGALIINPEGVEVRFTNKDNAVMETHYIEF